MTCRGRRIAILGTMMELGAWAAAAHREAGSLAAALSLDLLLAMGDHATEIARGAVASGMPPDRIYRFATHTDVISWLGNTLGDGDLLLVKGSRDMHMEEIVEGLRTE